MHVRGSRSESRTDLASAVCFSPVRGSRRSPRKQRLPGGRTAVARNHAGAYLEWMWPKKEGSSLFGQAAASSTSLFSLGGAENKANKYRARIIQARSTCNYAVVREQLKKLAKTQAGGCFEQLMLAECALHATRENGNFNWEKGRINSGRDAHSGLLEQEARAHLEKGARLVAPGWETMEVWMLSGLLEHATGDAQAANNAWHQILKSQHICTDFCVENNTDL